MALDPRRRAKQLAKKAAAAKARARQKKTHHSDTFPYQLGLIQEAARYLIFECYQGRGLLQSGFGTVVMSRRSGNTVASGVFLLDTYCLGVKSCFPRVQGERAYIDMLERLRRREDLIKVDAACARKLIEGAVAYARDLGFEPDEDYHATRLLFGDVDPAACPRRFEYGKDGKPLYVSGPNDTEQRIEEIVKALTRRCGRDGFHYIVLGSADDLDGEFE